MRMLTTRFWLFGALVVTLWVFAFDANALTQGQAVKCIREFYNITSMVQEEGDVEPSMAIAVDEASKFVNDAALRAAISYKIKVLDCRESANANAVFTVEGDGLPPDFTNENDIIYNREWVTSNLGSEEVKFVLGHEIGHITNNHNTTRKKIEDQTKELEADKAGGCFVANMGGSLATLESVMPKIRARKSADYGSLEQSLLEARTGFSNCSAPIPPNPLAGIKVVYFKKENDRGVVEAALQRNHISFEPRQGEFGEYSDILACTPDVPIEKTKLLALLLFEAGIQLKVIKSHGNSELTNRLQIESGWSSKDRANEYRPLTKKEIESLTTCSDMEPKSAEREMKFQNLCRLGYPTLYVRFLDSTDREWKTLRFRRSLLFGYELAVSNAEGRYYKTDRSFYYYAEIPDEGFWWPNREDADDEFELPDGRTVGFRKKSPNTVGKLTCRDY